MERTYERISPNADARGYAYDTGAFDDELGLLLLSNDWQVLTYQSDKNGNKPKEKNLFLIAGGGTNSITITLKEFEDVVINSDDVEEISCVRKH